MAIRSFITSFLVTSASLLSIAQAEPTTERMRIFETKIRPVLAEYCYKCHGPDKQKGDFRIDTLASRGLDPTQAEAWKKVAEAIEFGDMPPKKAPRPDGAAAERVVGWIGTSLAGIQTERPLALRRMNRVEYEHTVQDLLGIDTPLSDLLPEDGKVAGFDNNAGGLSVSSVLLERYLEASDVAFDGAIRRIKPLEPKTRRVNFMDVKENIESAKKGKGSTHEVDGSFVKLRPGWPPVRMDAVKPIEDGLYDVRLAVWPHQAGERTLAVAVYVGPLFGPGEKRFMGMYDVTGTSDDPRIVEFTARFSAAEAVHLVPWIYPTVDGWLKDVPKPGVAFKWIETHGPLDQAFPSEPTRALFGENVKMTEGENVWMRHRKGVKNHYVHSQTPKEDAERVLRAFIPRAFRRPVDSADMAPYIALVHDRLEAGRTYEDAMRAGINAVLCSPQFLVLNRDTSVDDYTIASRMSYFLWSSMPDDELIRLAAAGKLREPKVRRAQVDRMLNDPKIERFIESFTGQWLDLREIEFTTPDKKLYKEFDDLLQESMLGETRGFFRHMLAKNRSVTDFIDSDWTVLNQRIAAHYGIDGVEGHEKFRVVKLPDDSIRGGVLTHGSVLKVTANGTTTSPILRGVWVLEHLLNQPAPPPPAGVPAVEPDIRGAVSIRDQLDKHRANASCARCHVRIDPPGFALETFDPIGGARESYRRAGKSKQPPIRVEANGELPDGRTFDGFRGFREHLMNDREKVIRAVAGNLMTYASGRELGPADRPTIDKVVEATQQNNHGLRSMIHAVVDSELFIEP